MWKTLMRNFFVKSGLATDAEWNAVLYVWESLIGDVYAKMYKHFPKIINADLVDVLLEREREIPE